MTRSQPAAAARIKGNLDFVCECIASTSSMIVTDPRYKSKADADRRPIFLVRLADFVCLSFRPSSPGQSHGSVWSSLLGRELSLSPSSREYRELECFRQSMSSQHNFDGEIERAFTKMAQLFTKRATQHAKNLNRIRSILDEPQFCAMVEWMNRDHHQAAVKMEA